MAFSRVAGILLHPTSLPGPGGIGTLGEYARSFVDTLERTGIGLWQVLPLGPTGYGDSPYSALSAFAGNPFLIALEPLVERGWLQETDLARLPRSSSEAVDFGELVPSKMAVLRRAFDRFEVQQVADSYHHFLDDNSGWLDDFCLYMAIKDAHGGHPWNLWPANLRSRDASTLSALHRDLATDLDFHRFVQFVFFDQWSALKYYANERNIQIVGDIPIFVAYDSADVWANQTLFRLDVQGLPTVVAGVPPDYFSPTGQLWGNPHYRWDAMAADGYQWWIDRFRMCLRLVDIVRLDHFRGFAAAWAIPYGNPTAERGEWTPSPGHELFSALQAALHSPPIIAEDLGVITPDVDQLRATFGFPGMKILQFAFGDGPSGDGLPHNYDRNTVVYTGTHDNDTTAGWFTTIEPGEQEFVLRYLASTGQDVVWDLIRLAFASVADLAIVPLQDILRAGSASRMNSPGQAEGNWSWRSGDAAITDLTVMNLRMLVETYGRLPKGSGQAASDSSTASE